MNTLSRPLQGTAIVLSLLVLLGLTLAPAVSGLSHLNGYQTDDTDMTGADTGDTMTDTGDTTTAQSFSADLDGSNEVPPVESNATGTATFDVNGDVEYTLSVEDIEDVTQAHIHLGGPNENGPVVAYLANYTAETDGTGGTPQDGPIDVSGNIDSSDLVGPLEGQTLADLQDAMENNNAYVNVHTVEHPDGEIRGQIQEDTDATPTDDELAEEELAEEDTAAADTRKGSKKQQQPAEEGVLAQEEICVNVTDHRVEFREEQEQVTLTKEKLNIREEQREVTVPQEDVEFRQEEELANESERVVKMGKKRMVRETVRSIETRSIPEIVRSERTETYTVKIPEVVEKERTVTITNEIPEVVEEEREVCGERELAQEVEREQIPKKKVMEMARQQMEQELAQEEQPKAGK